MLQYHVNDVNHLISAYLMNAIEHMHDRIMVGGL
jgi:hypothetical protein